MSSDHVWAVIVAAGKSSRMGGPAPKQFLPWKGYPLYWHSALAFARSPEVEGIVFVFSEEYCAAETENIARYAADSSLGVLWKTARGGQRRQDSVRNGLALLPAQCEKVLIHDAARPFVTPKLVNRVLEAFGEGIDGVVPAVPVTDTIKVMRGDEAEIISGTPDRGSLRAAQTPQAFRTGILRQAHANGEDVTDDSAMLEKMGCKIRVVAGDAANVKITNPGDLELLAAKPRARTGFGYDVHKYGGGRPLKLGGVLIPGGMSVQAHSDGDVLIHALMDAILGCAGLGDIGGHFPDSDPELENISSAVLLDETLRLAREAGVEIYQADLTIIAQKPRIAPYKQEIRKNMARLLSLPESRVNLKATTEEGLGFTGNLEGIKACAIVLGYEI